MGTAQNYRLIDQAEVKGKKILVRVDFNVPLDGEGNITNDLRIRDALPTLRYLLDHQSKIILMSHLGRPPKKKGRAWKQLSMDAIGVRLSKLLGHPVKKLDDCIGESVTKETEKMQSGDVILLENLRFHPEEMTDDDRFAHDLADLADIYCNEAFSVSHRKQASVHAIASCLPSYAGFLLDKEVRTITEAMSNPKRPLIAIVGGMKLETKLPLIEHLLTVADRILITGAMVFTFLRAQGKEVGDSLVDENAIDLAKKLLADHGDKLLLPTDVAIAEQLAPGKERQEVPVDAIPPGMRGLDIGEESVEKMKTVLRDAKTIIWNGPLGAFEMEPFGWATEMIAQFLAGLDSVRIIGGGDTAAAIELAGVGDRMTHISTGGGAALMLFSGEKLVAVEGLGHTH